MNTRVLALLASIGALLTLAACGGGGTSFVKPQTFTIGGTVSGLTASGLVLTNNGGDSLTVASGATSFQFATAISSGAAYSVAVGTQPAGLTCTVASGTGTASANVTNVAVTCAATTFTISVNVSGLTGTGLVLQDNNTDNLSVSANGTFPFATGIAQNGNYAVTILTQPTGQTCSLGSNATGQATADVTVNVTCSAQLYTISVNVSGLTGTGLVLQDNGGDNLPVTANGTFPFATQIVSGAAYNVTILTPPAGQSCGLDSNAQGTATADVTVAVTCSALPTFTLSATVSGQTGGSLVLVDDQAQQLIFTSNGTQTFTNVYFSGAPYAVTILTQPLGQTCTIGGTGTGTITANTTVTVSCIPGLYTVNANVSGLTGTGLVLLDNGTDSLTIPGNGTTPFQTQVPNGSPYNVTIQTQPSGQTCTLGVPSSGVINGADVSVNVTCGTTTTYQITVSVTGLTGTLIVQDDQSENLTFTTSTSQTFPHQYPGGTNYTVTVTSQPSGQNCQLSSNATGSINANTTVTATCTTSVNSGEWTWVAGQKVVAVQGTYPPNTPAFPGTRYAAATWQDASGNFWMWGGWGYDINGPTVSCTNCGSNESAMSDLWEYKGGAWTFKGGQAQTGQCFDFPTSTGTTGSPSARSDAVSWTDAGGNMFMFGGYEVYNTPGSCNLADAFNDMWEYNVSANTWTWVNGSSTQKQKGTYNGIGSTGTPGARYWSTGQSDSNGNFWMFGGYAYDKNGTGQGYINDMWEWNGTTWTWVSGSSTSGAKGVYTGSSAVPGGRIGANSWFDSSGNFWLFGGLGYDSTGAVGELNDLWSFNPSSSKWTFVGGSTTANPVASYGTQGVADPSNVPGGRAWAASWVTPSGDVYVLGGQQLGGGLLNDLWKYSGGNWTWIAPDMPSDGSQFVNELGVYGTQGVANSANAPGSREQGMSWTDASGNLWLLGGFGWGTIANGAATNVHAGTDSMNDIWEFQP